MVSKTAETNEGAIQLHEPGMPAQRLETFHSGGVDHPIMAAHQTIVSTFYMAGERPVVSSELDVKDYYMAMGNERPVASNQIDDAPSLMGFLD
jgi:hypothetical protein